MTGLALVPADAAPAQQPPVGVRGEFEQVDGTALTIKARDGNLPIVALADNVHVMALVRPRSPTSSRTSYIGVTADPQPDGTEKAVNVGRGVTPPM